MKSAMAAIRSNALSKQIMKESERIISLFASNSNAKARATTKVVKRILLNGPYLFNETMWEVKSKSLGAGVYELSLEKQSE